MPNFKTTRRLTNGLGQPFDVEVVVDADGPEFEKLILILANKALDRGTASVANGVIRVTVKPKAP